MIVSFRHNGLAAFWKTGDTSKLRTDHVQRVRRRLDELDVAKQPEDMNVPGYKFHKLHGKPQRYAISVSGQWRITFEWDGQDAVKVDYEQYH
jgi:proteic killer suppression protein